LRDSSVPCPSTTPFFLFFVFPMCGSSSPSLLGRKIKSAKNMRPWYPAGLVNFVLLSPGFSFPIFPLLGLGSLSFSKPPDYRGTGFPYHYWKMYVLILLASLGPFPLPEPSSLFSKLLGQIALFFLSRKSRPLRRLTCKRPAAFL